MNEFLYLSLACLFAALFYSSSRPRPKCFRTYPTGQEQEQRSRGCQQCRFRAICISETKPDCYGDYSEAELVDRYCWHCHWIRDCQFISLAKDSLKIRKGQNR